MHKLLISAVIAATLAGAQGASAQGDNEWKGTGEGVNPQATTTKQKGSEIYADEAEGTAVVEAIDYETREFTLAMPDGTTVTRIAGPEIKRFNEIKKGDGVHIKYIESVALSLHEAQPGEKPAIETKDALVRGKGKHPSAHRVTTVDVVAEVIKVDKTKRKLTIKGPEGNVAVVQVKPEVADISTFKKGDSVYITYTRSVAVEIIPKKQMKKTA